MLGGGQQGQLGWTRAGGPAQEGRGGQVDGDEEAGCYDSEARTGRETLSPEDGGSRTEGLQTQRHHVQ